MCGCHPFLSCQPQLSVPTKSVSRGAAKEDGARLLGTSLSFSWGALRGSTSFALGRQGQSRWGSSRSACPSGWALGAVTSPLWPQPGLKFSSADTISGVFTWSAIKTMLLQQVFTVQFVLRTRRKKNNKKINISGILFLTDRSAWMQRAVPQPHCKLFSCLSCFPHTAGSNLCPGQGDRWLTGKTWALPGVGRMLQQIGCLFHLQPKEKEFLEWSG